MTAFPSRCRPPLSVHYLIILLSYNKCISLPRAASGFPLFQGKTLRESACFPRQWWGEAQTDPQHPGEESSNLLKQAADLLGSHGLKRPQWRGQRYPAASFLSKYGVLHGWKLLLCAVSCAGAAHLCHFQQQMPLARQSGLSLSASPSNTDFLYYTVKPHVL